MANWTPEEIQVIWEKAEPSVQPDMWRKDQCGAWIYRKDYGNRQSDYGWEIDHIKPESKGGEDVLSNARPLHWLNNASRQAGRLTCVVTSDGNRNVRR